MRLRHAARPYRVCSRNPKPLESPARRSVAKHASNRAGARHPICALAAVSVLVSACNQPEPDAALTQDLIEAALEPVVASLSDSVFLVRPRVGDRYDIFEVAPAFDSADEAYLRSTHPELPTGLFGAGREANRFETELVPRVNSHLTLLPPEFDPALDTQLGQGWSGIETGFGKGSVVFTFAQPAVSASGEEALVYHVRSQHGGMTRTAEYSLLRRSRDRWTVVWRITTYEE